MIDVAYRYVSMLWNQISIFSLDLRQKHLTWTLRPLFSLTLDHPMWFYVNSTSAVQWNG